MVLRRGAEESDAANVNLLDRISERTTGLRDRGGERIEVADDNGDGRDALCLQILLVGRDGTREDTCSPRSEYDVAGTRDLTTGSRESRRGEG